MKVAILLFFLGGGSVRGSETLEEAPPPLNDLLPRTVKSFVQFSYSVIPPPPSFWIRPCVGTVT